MELFCELLQVAIGNRDNLSKTPSEKEWAMLFANAQKQAVVGVTFLALEALSRYGQKPSLPLLYEWIGQTELIKNRNKLLNKQCYEITKLFAGAGFLSCILKGQGNGLMYPEPLLRTPGDIDVWIDGDRDEIKKFVMDKYPMAKDGPLHIAFQPIDGVEVEAHYYAIRTSNPKYRNRMRTWIKDHKKEQFSNKVMLGDAEICVPTTRFNVVYQMSHIMVHFFEEGIGLRHFIDYFFVLKKLHDAKYSESYESLFKHLGLLKFARGVMWVEQEELGMSDEYLICEPDEKIGRVILKEIEEGGNFGHHDKRYSLRHKGYLARGVADGYRLIKLSQHFPQDALWKIVRRIENQKWKL